jgi:hypothetical protein
MACPNNLQKNELRQRPRSGTGVHGLDILLYFGDRYVVSHKRVWDLGYKPNARFPVIDKFNTRHVGTMAGWHDIYPWFKPLSQL